MGSYDRYKKRVCTKKRESISIIKKKKKQYMSLLMNNWKKNISNSQSHFK